MLAPNENATAATVASASQISPVNHITDDPVDAARQRLRDAIIAVGLPYHHGVMILAAAESYGKAMRHEVRQ